MTLLQRLRSWFSTDTDQTEQADHDTPQSEPEPVDDHSADGLSARPYRSPSNGRRKRSIPDTIEKYYIPTAVLNETQRYIEEHGERGHEAYVLWAGSIADNEAYVTTCIYPNTDTRHGGVDVPRSKMREILKELHDRDQIVIAQAHSHPGVARHSQLDEEKPVSFHEGFASIVVPDFGETPIYDLRDCGVYIYTQQEQWRLLDDDEIEETFAIEPTTLEI
jgi:proteasome lid subunit RPN8/RPN11